MSIPVNVLEQLKEPGAAEKLRQQYGGAREVDKDGSVYTSVGNRPIPPPKALKKIHAHRQDERRQREEALEAEEFERVHGMGVKESRTSLNLVNDRSAEAIRRRRELAQRDIEVRLCETAYEYQVYGCGLAECDGTYAYSSASCNGAPVYQNAAGWTLHRDRPFVQATIGTDQEVAEFGWLISKERKPFYAAKTEALLAPEHSWECFYGPPPAPATVSVTSWERHFTESCGLLKDGGNTAIQQGKAQEAEDLYSEALGLMAGFEDVVSSSGSLRQLRVALHANRAEARLRLRRGEAALEDCRWVLSQEPGHAKAAVRLAKACRLLGRWGDAIGPLTVCVESCATEGSPEVGVLLEEAQVLAVCERGESELSGVFMEALHLREVLDRRRAGSSSASESPDVTAQTLVASLERLFHGTSHCGTLQTQAGLLLRGLAIVEAAVVAVPNRIDSAWGIDLLAACLRPDLREDDLRRILDVLPAAAARLVEQPDRALRLVRRLLRHKQRQQLKVADRLIEVRGLLVGCLRPWTKMLDARYGAVADDAPVEVLHQLEAQVQKLDNIEALALALFVEGFIGEKLEEGVTGGFVLYTGAAVRQVVLTLLQHWAEDQRVLKSLSPELVGRVWSSLSVKLRRDAGEEVERQVPSGGKRALKLEWFKLKQTSTLRKGVGAFYPEELLEAMLNFLHAHLEATCDRGEERLPVKGIVPRHPAEEWMDEVLDKTFGWGVLLPLVVAPPAIAAATVVLLEALIRRHPHNEKLANRLAGLHVFMPLLRMPWPPSQPAVTHLGATLATSSSVRRSICAVLRCTVDTEMAMRIVKDHIGHSVDAVLRLLETVLQDHDQPDSVIAVTEVLGIITSNFRCWDKVPQDTIFSVLQEFMRSTHMPTRSQLAKLLRLAHEDEVAAAHLRAALADERLALSEVQSEQVFREVFDFRTLAGQVKAERLLELAAKQEHTPVDTVLPDHKMQTQEVKLVNAINQAYLAQRTKPRILVMGRIGRSLCRCFAGLDQPIQVVLGETTLDKLNQAVLGPEVKTLLLPVPQGVESDADLSSQDHFDLVITGEPMGYFDMGEYADRLRPFIKRREKEDERRTDQVQWLCIELRERIEDARDELYSAGYYNAGHDQAFEMLRKAALKMDRELALFSLPSYERECRRMTEHQRAVQRKDRREREEKAKARRDEEDERRRGVLYETLFDPLLSPPEADVLPVAFEVGATRAEADLVIFWLHGNGEDPAVWRPLLEELAASARASAGAAEGAARRVRIMAPTLPAGQTCWYRWSDEVAVNFGMEWYEMSEGPSDEALAKAAKEPAQNISFGKPSFEEMQCLEEMEVACKQLLNLAEEEVIRGLRPEARIAFGGYSQGGSIGVYAALSGMATTEVQSRLCGIVPCCSGVPVFHFLASKMQATCLAAKENGISEQPIKVHLVFGSNDPQVKESFVQTSRDLYRRFDFHVTIHRFNATLEERFPSSARLGQLGQVISSLLAQT